MDATAFANTNTVFDGLQRLTQNQQALNQAGTLNETRTIAYNDAENNCVITENNGRTETHVWNDSGQALTVTTKILTSEISRVKTNYYDVAGRRTSVLNIDGQISNQLFDSLNRLRFTITPMGRVAEIKYDDINRYHCTTHYINTGTPSVPPIPAVDDTTTYSSFRGFK